MISGALTAANHVRDEAWLQEGNTGFSLKTVTQSPRELRDCTEKAPA